MDPAISELLIAYDDLNSASIDELTDAPSALEFMRHVARNRPFVVRNGAAHWEATRTWDLATLKALLAGQDVNVAVTPNGRADAPTVSEDGELLFVKPWEEQQSFQEFVDYVAEQERSGGGGEIRYAQTQNDNLRNEYATLFSHVEKDIPWARIALQNEPEAINLWIGNSRSVTALHKDNYENIYVQIIGQKHFVLLPPLCYPCVAEQLLPSATYHRSPSPSNTNPSLSIKKEEDTDKIPFPTWDPDAPSTTFSTLYSHLAIPIRCTLNKGDILYLPALWYHKVSQSCSEEGICCAVNYWHDMEFGGGFYPLCNFVRSVALNSGGSGSGSGC